MSDHHNKKVTGSWKGMTEETMEELVDREKVCSVSKVDGVSLNPRPSDL